MSLQRIDRVLIDLDEVPALQNLIVIRRRLRLDALLRSFQRQIRCAYAILCRRNAAFELTACIERQRSLEHINKLAAIRYRSAFHTRIGIAALTHSRSRPGKGRTASPAGTLQGPAGHLLICRRLLDGTIIFHRHPHTVVQVNIHGIRSQHRSAQRQAQEPSQYQRCKLFAIHIFKLISFHTKSPCLSFLYQNFT